MERSSHTTAGGGKLRWWGVTVFCLLVIGILFWSQRARARAAIDASLAAAAAAERFRPVDSSVASSSTPAAGPLDASATLAETNAVSENGVTLAAAARPIGPRAIALEEALELARQSLDRINREVEFYTGRLIRRERLNGELSPETEMAFKIQTRLTDGDRLVRPLGVYLHFLRPEANAGREVIWVEGQNDNQLIAHEAGLMNLMRANLDIKGWLAMRGMRYSIDQIGLQNLLEQLLVRGAEAASQPGVSAKLVPQQAVGGRPCTLLEVVQPEPLTNARFHIARIYMDDERQIPLLYESYMWPNEPGGEPLLDEQYTYLDVELNPPEDPRAFDPDNPAYNYP